MEFLNHNVNDQINSFNNYLALEESEICFMARRGIIYLNNTKELLSVSLIDKSIIEYSINLMHP